MKSTLKTGKKVLAIVMAVFMVMTAWVFVAPDKAEAGSYKAQDKTMGDLLFVVPEAIYCYPDALAQAVSRTHIFQYYVNNSSSGTANSSYSTTGSIYYSYAGASSASISWGFVSSDLTSSVSGGSVSLSSSTISNGGSVSITGGTTPTLAASTNGAWLQWTLSYTDSVDGVAKKVYAYTYVYKPYTIPVAAGADAGTGASGANWAGSVTWINGFHSLTEVSGDLDSDWDSRYNLYTNMSNFSSFVNPGGTGYVNGTSCTGSKAKITSYSYTTSGYSTDYALFANSSGTGYYFNHSPSNSNPSYLGSGSSGTYTSPVRNYRVGKYKENTKNVQACVVTNTYGNITIDTSRYSNLNQIPNVSIGMTVTDDEASGSSTGTWYIADYTDMTCTGYSTWHTGADNRSKYYSDYNYRIAGQGTGATDCSYSETEGIRYAGKWPRTLIGSTGTQGATYMYMAKGFYGNKDGGYYASSHCVVKMNAIYRNKASLRSAVYSAMKKFPALGVNNISGGYIKSCYFDDDSSYKWTAFRNAYRAAYRALVTLDDSNNMDTLASNLTNALNALCTKVTFNANGGSFATGSATHYITIGSAQKVAITFSNYATVSRTGYTFAGWKEANSTTTQTTSDTVGYNYSYTAQWTPIAYTVIFNANGGTGTMSNQSRKYDDGVKLTANSFTKEGYSFANWNTAANGSSTSWANQATGNLTSSAGNVNLYAQWSINQYPVIFKNGDTTIQTTYLNYGTAVTTTTYDNPTPTKAYDTENHYNFIGWLPEFHTVAASNTGNIYTANFETVPHDYLTTQYTAPTCTSDGSKTLMCNCGYTKTETLYTSGHSWNAGTVITQPTCSSTGTKRFSCTVCGAIRTEEIPIDPSAHIYPSAWTTRNEATCTENGLEYKKCALCSNEITQQIQPLGHDEVSHAAQAPTCTEIGWNAYVTCSRCDYTTYVEIKATGHTEVSHAAQAPTCTEIGWNAYVTCSRCDYTTYVEIKATGHTEVIDSAVSPTCTETGLTEGKHCSVCNAVLVAQEEIPATGHTEVVDKAVSPTCTETGLTEGKHCSVCGEVITAQEVIPATGHSYGEWSVKQAATCTEAGTKEKTCACGDTVTETIPAMGHDIVVDAAVAATCTTTGLTEGSHCSRCNNATIAQEVVPATDHTPVSANNAVEAKCGVAGKEADTVCSVCGTTITEGAAIPALEHKAIVDEAVEAKCNAVGKTEGSHCELCGEVLVEQQDIPMTPHTEVADAAIPATCETAGKTAGSHCSVCNEVITVQQTVPAQGHQWNSGVITKEASCSETGVKTYTCTVESCGKTRTEVIEKTPHTIVEDPAVEPTSCTQTGLTAGSHCSVCNEVIVEQQVIPALNHSYPETGVLLQEATCTSQGIVEYTCTVCSTSYIEYLEKKSHDYVSAVTVEPGTETEGERTYTCSVCGDTYTETIPALGKYLVCKNPIGNICELANKYRETPIINWILALIHSIFHFIKGVKIVTG